MNIQRIAVGEPKEFTIFAREMYSEEKLLVKAGDEYFITCDPSEQWTDWYITRGPTGYKNILASLFGLRLKKSACFCLCGAFDDNDDNLFEIGTQKEIKIGNEHDSKTMSFFANDTRGFYWNNKGQVKVVVARLQ